MAKQFNIDPNDRDLLLAQTIGRALPGLKRSDDLNDPLFYTLLQYKESEEKSLRSEPDSNRLWDLIDKETESISEQINAPVFRLGSGLYRYAAAAVILIMAFGGIFWYQQNLVPQLIGESFASIETISLNDGTMITLRPYSKLYKKSKNSGEDYQLTGEALFEVNSDPDRIFSVETPESRVEVLGTTFTVSDWGEQTEVYLQEGSVRLSSRISDESVILSPGESGSANLNGLLNTKSVSERTYTDWLNSQMTFDSASLSYIFSELEQHFNISIQSEPATDSISGTIVLDNLEQVLNDLELLLDGTFIRTGDNKYRFSLNN